MSDSKVIAPRKSLKKIKDETVFYPHQIEGVRILARMGSFILADEMGLGKTLEALTVAAIDFERGWIDRVLFVTLASLKYNVEADIQDHTKFTSTVLEGSAAKRSEQLLKFDADILIINYEQIKPHIHDLNKMGFGIVIYDEAHAMKNYKSQRTKACLSLVADRFFLLTGSPLLNQVNELWPLLHRIDPANYPNYWRFVNRYAVFGGYKDKQIVGVKHQQELRSNLERVMVRRLKKDVLHDLPDKMPPLIIPVDFHPEQAKMYRQAVEEMKIDLPGDPTPMELENALSKGLRLKQICGTTFTLTDEDHSIKLDVATEKAIEITEDKGDVPGEPLVIFTQFRRVQEAMLRRLDAEGIPTFQLNGDTPKNQRVEVVRAWGESPQPAVVVAMLQVAGVGLNMTYANKCIFLDKLWVPKLNEQAEDRLHRIGQKNAVQIIQIVVRNSIEHRIETVLRRKRKLFDSLVEESQWKKALYEAMLEADAA